MLILSGTLTVINGGTDFGLDSTPVRDASSPARFLSQAARQSTATHMLGWASGAPAPAAPAPAAPAQAATSVVDPNQRRQALDLCLVLDTTASMDGGIKAVLKFLKVFIAKAASKFHTRVGLVLFDDYDPHNLNKQPIKCYLSFQDVEAVQEVLDRVRCDGGEDLPEAVETALKASLDLFSDSNSEAQKMALLITDAAPHAQGDSGDNYPFYVPSQIDYWGIVDQFVEKGVSLSILGCKNFTHINNVSLSASNVYTETAERTNGRLFKFEEVQDKLDDFLYELVEEERFVNVCVQAAREFPEGEAQIEELARLMASAPTFRSLGCTMAPQFNKDIFTNCPNSASFSRAIQAASSEPKFRSLSSSEEPSSEEPAVPMGFRSCSTTASEHVQKTSHMRALAYLKNKTK